MAVPGACLFWMASVVIMLLPRQGEWIVGGWDPGTYVDQGVWVSHTGTFGPAPDSLFSVFKPDELPLFAPQVLNFTEGMPVFPLDPEQRSFEPFFFRFMPTLTAVLDRLGGLRAATRVNLWMGLFAAAMVLWVVAACFRGRLFLALAGILVILHPVWVYHLHFPTSELLQQGLLFGVVALVARRDETTAASWFAAAGFFALLVTHLSFVLFASLLLLAIAWAELGRGDRNRVLGDRSMQVAGILAGVAYDLMTASVTVERLGFILTPLLGLSAVLMGLALALDWAGGRAWFERLLVSRIGGLAVFGLLLAYGFTGWVAYGSHSALFGEQRANMSGAVPFLVPLLIGVALPGLLVFGHRSPASRCGKALVFVALVATFMTLWEGAIMPLYPWATRRYLVFTVPMLAILASYTLILVAKRSSSRFGMVVAASGALLLVMTMAPRVWRAWSATEYDGISVQLERIAGEFGPRDVILADRFCYGIPLRFIHGRAVLNGERLVELTGADRIRRAAGILKRLHDEGWRIRFLTSTTAGMDIFPFRLKALRTDFQSEPFTLSEVFHEAYVRDYAMRTLERQWMISTWVPDMVWLEDGFGTNRAGIVDVGTEQDVWWIVAGFHEREQAEGGSVSVRWTTGYGVMALPETVCGSALRVELDYLDKHRPPFEPADPVEMLFNGEPVFAEKTVSVGGKRLTAYIPARLNRHAHPRLAIRCKPWVPVVSRLNSDSRSLGVMVDRLSYSAVPDGGGAEVGEERSR